MRFAGLLCRGMILVPLDPHDPLVRLRHVLSEAQASCCVTKDWGDAKMLGTCFDFDGFYWFV